MKKSSTRKRDSSKAGSVKTAVADQELLQRIAEKAYELYRQRGSGNSHDMDDWLEAERLVLAERKARTQ